MHSTIVSMESQPPAEIELSVWDQESRRTREEGIQNAEKLLQELDVLHADAKKLMEDKNFRRLIIRWAIEFPLNINWYNQEIPKQEKSFNRSRHFAIALSAVTILGTTALVIFKKNVSVAEFGVLIAGIFGVLQTMAAAGDPKARLGGFRKARADLKESMFTFVERWAGKVVDTQNKEPNTIKSIPDFMTALLDEIRTGRKISRDERDTYFGTFKSSTEILSAANTALDYLKNKRSDLTAAISAAGATTAAAEQALSSRIQTLRIGLAEATAQRDSLVNKKERLQKDNPADPKLKELQNTIEDAETLRFKAQALLDMAIKSDIVHPV